MTAQRISQPHHFRHITAGGRREMLKKKKEMEKKNTRSPQANRLYHQLSSKSHWDRRKSSLCNGNALCDQIEVFPYLCKFKGNVCCLFMIRGRLWLWFVIIKSSSIFLFFFFYIQTKEIHDRIRGRTSMSASAVM